MCEALFFIWYILTSNLMYTLNFCGVCCNVYFNLQHLGIICSVNVLLALSCSKFDCFILIHSNTDTHATLFISLKLCDWVLKMECHITSLLATLNPAAPDQYVRLNSSHTEPFQMHTMQFFILSLYKHDVSHSLGNLCNWNLCNRKLVFLRQAAAVSVQYWKFQQECASHNTSTHRHQ